MFLDIIDIPIKQIVIVLNLKLYFVYIKVE